MRPRRPAGRVRRYWPALLCAALLALLVYAARSPEATPERPLTVDAPAAAPPDPPALLRQAFSNLRAAATLRIDLQHSGEPWFVSTNLGELPFRQLRAAFVAPDTLQAVARVAVLGLPVEVELFARGEQQWYRNPLLTANRWQGGVLVEGFNPQQLVSADSGFHQVPGALGGLTWQGLVALEDGRAAHHLRGRAQGAALGALLLNLVQLSGELPTEVYIERDSVLPRRFVIREPAASWDLGISEVNAAVQLDIPPGVGR